MAIKIGSFNVRNLADGMGRDLDKIAKIINENNLDIICLQEVLQEGKVIKGYSVKGLTGQAKAYNRSLISRLSGQWDSEWAQPRIRSNMEQYLSGDNRGEGYAILWRKDKFIFPKDIYGKDIRPYIYENYDSRIAKSKLRLIRDPMYSRFIIKGRKTEIRLLTTHIIYGKSEKVKDLFDYGAIEMRKKEYYMLAGQIYYRINNSHKDVTSTSSYTIMLGDYNLNLGSTLPMVVCFDSKGHVIDETGNDVIEIYNIQDNKTTLKRDVPELANSYDHFSMDARTKKQIIPGSVRVIDAIHNYNLGKSSSEEEAFNDYRTKVSDHLPIILSINV